MVTAKKEQHPSGAVLFLEAPPGIGPGNKGFADLCLTAWLWRRIRNGNIISCRGQFVNAFLQKSFFIFKMGGRGVDAGFIAVVQRQKEKPEAIASAIKCYGALNPYLRERPPKFKIRLSANWWQIASNLRGSSP